MNQFAIGPQVRFGVNALEGVADMPARQALLITDKSMVKFGMADRIISAWHQRNVAWQMFDDVLPDPDVAQLVRGMKVMDSHWPELLVALGGGSVIDAAKAMLFMLCQKYPQRPRPQFVAIPTTSGTGSEVTSFSVVTAEGEKQVLVDDFMLPDVAILDPTLVSSVPPGVTADTGMDVLCHALEAYVSRNASDFSDALAEKAVRLVFDWLPGCWRQGNSLDARAKMHSASCIAGMAFTNAGLGITHSLAHALGAAFHIPHGRANALLMAHVVAFNAGFSGCCDNSAARRYAALAGMLGLPAATTREGVASLLLAITTLRDSLEIPASLSAAGIGREALEARLPEMVALAGADRCTPTNPLAVDARTLTALYRHAFAGTPFNAM